MFACACGFVQAQDWSKEDSLWLIRVLEGKERLRINEDTKKAIESGRLIMPSWLKDDIERSEDGMIRDFEGVGSRDSARIHSLDPYTMPPAVYAMYVLYMEKIDSVYHNNMITLTEDERKRLEEAMPYSARNRFYYSDIVPGIGGVGNMDFNHILCMMFHPSYRRKALNRKNAGIYKHQYDETGAIRSTTMTEGERRQIRQSLINIKTSSGRDSYGAKRNGIDD